MGAEAGQVGPVRPGWWQRVFGEVETVGVGAVPERQRTLTPLKLFIVWAMASASATTPLIAMLLFKLGLTNLVITVVIAFLIGLIPAGLFSEMGRDVPLIALIVARKTYGHGGAFLFALLFTLVNAGWFGLNTAVGGQILEAVLPQPGLVFWLITIGLIQVVLVLFGMKWLEYFYRYTSAVFVVCYGALAVYLFVKYHPAAPAAAGPVNWGMAISTVVSFSILAWTYKLSTVSRFAVPAARTEGYRATYFLAPTLGIMLAVLLMAVVGIYAQSAIHTWNVAVLGKETGILGFLAALGVALAIVHTNAMNLYPSTVDLLVALNSLRKPFRWEQPVATIGLGILATTLAVGGIINRISGFLEFVGVVIFPFTFIMVVDWLFIQKRRTPSDAFFEPPRNAGDWIWWPGVAAFAAGFLVGAFGDRFLPAFFYQVLPLTVVASVLAAGLYLLLAKVAHRSVSTEARRRVAIQ